MQIPDIKIDFLKQNYDVVSHVLSDFFLLNFADPRFVNIQSVALLDHNIIYNKL